MSFVRNYYSFARKYRRLVTKLTTFRNRHTGEVWEAESEEPPKRRKPQERNWISMNQPEMLNLVHGRVRGQEMRLLLLLMANCSWNNKVYMKQKVLADELGISRQNVYQLVKRLEAGMFLWADPNDRGAYYIEPMLCWKGSPTERTNAHNSFKQLFSSVRFAAGSLKKEIG